LNLNLTFDRVSSRSISRSVRASGAVRLDESRVSDVVSRIAGVVGKAQVSLGQIVKAGDPLVELESAELSAAITTYVDAEQAMRFSISTLEQEKALFEKNLTSREQLREKELAYDQAFAGHSRALQPLKLLHFDEGLVHGYLNGAEDGNYTILTIRAPMAGEIIAQNIRQGAAVGPDESLYTVADLSVIWVDCSVPLKDIGMLAVGDQMNVRATVSDQVGEGKIIYIAPLADEQSRTVMVRGAIENSDRVWRPGTPVDVRAIAKSGEASLAVPNSSLVDFEGSKAVFVRLENGSFVPTPVETGEIDEEFTGILKGLSGTETIVIGNVAQLKGHLEMTAEE
jgi:cobalt-zinc-cadmium efflux system membrane fusion protein